MLVAHARSVPLALSLVVACSDGRSYPPPDGGRPATYAERCCPPAPFPAVCMALGGARWGQSCFETCDILVSNVRMSQDAQGCAVWAYDPSLPGPSPFGPRADAATSRDAADAGADTGITESPEGGPAPSGGDPVCCPISSGFPSGGCMNLGGAARGAPGDAGCYGTCDFFCARNFRREVDDAGCDVIVYDTRLPAPGEDVFCNARDGGAP